MAFYAALLIPLFPLVAGTLIGLFGKQLGQQSYKIGVPAILLAFFSAVWVLVTVSQEGPIRIALYQATGSRDYMQLTLYIDRLSAVMMVLITGVSSIVHLYSVRYMQGERGYARFYSLLGLITAVLLCLVTSANLLMLFVFWQLLTWLLYLLLVYNYEHPPAVQFGFKTLLVHRLGDVAFLGGILLAYLTYGTLDFPDLFARAAANPATVPLWPGGFEIGAATAITLLLFGGGMSKSAQFPLHVWLPDTMDTPTPVSALMHAGIVNAAGFLINRLAPLYGLAPTTLHVVFVIGALTAILGAAMMLTQSDIKKMLGFSTMGQMGYMTMECGLGAFALSIFHLIAHGIFKATLFLYAGSAIHDARRDPGRRRGQHIPAFTLGRRLGHDLDPAVGHLARRARPVADSAARDRGAGRHYPAVFRLGDLLAGHHQSVPAQSGGLLAGGMGHGAHAVCGRLHLSLGSRGIHALFIPSSRRGCSVFPGRGVAHLDV
jgi:NADH-quinone oxidoreductase subunit L